jgi:hypothetical protein
MGTLDLPPSSFLHRKPRQRRKTMLFPGNLETFLSFSIELKKVPLFQSLLNGQVTKKQKNKPKPVPNISPPGKVPFPSSWNKSTETILNFFFKWFMDS